MSKAMELAKACVPQVESELPLSTHGRAVLVGAAAELIQAEISRLQSRIEELERALKPFADGLTYLDQMDLMRKEYLASISCTGKFGEAELIQARSALEASNQGGK